MLYAVVTVMALIASCYLLFRDGNAFAAHITSPVRLRRWTAAFFGVFVLNHLWYMLPLFFLTSSEDIKLTDLAGGLLDSITFFPLAIIVLLIMLQDRQRPLWPAWAMVMPVVVGMVWCVISQSDALLPILIAYLLLMSVGLIIYLVRALRQYGRWLRDNYADLEHKEVWQSFVVLAVMLLVFGSYMLSDSAPAYEYALQLVVVLLVGYLLWRVETLSDLSISQQQDLPADLDNSDKDESNVSQNDLTDNIELLLQKYCIDTQLYLQHDLTLPQLAKAIGTNRFYLSRYFSRQGTTYNAYINGLRIDHFISLYRRAVAAKEHITVRSLAQDSGFHNYATFSNAFKQRMGKNVTAWMQESSETSQSN